MSEFYKTSTVWVIDFRYDGHPRRWFKALPGGADARRQVTATLHGLYGDKARLVAVRPASGEEELQYLRDEGPRNATCPLTPRGPRSAV